MSPAGKQRDGMLMGLFAVSARPTCKRRPQQAALVPLGSRTRPLSGGLLTRQAAGATCCAACDEDNLLLHGQQFDGCGDHLENVI